MISNGAEHYGTNKQIMTCVLAPGWLQIRLLGLKRWKILENASFSKISEGTFGSFLVTRESSPKPLQIHGFQSKSMNMNNFDVSKGAENDGTHRYKDSSTFIQSYLYQTLAYPVKQRDSVLISGVNYRCCSMYHVLLEISPK